MAISSPDDVKFSITSRKNPAGQAIAAQVIRFKLLVEEAVKFVRVCSHKEIEELEGRH